MGRVDVLDFALGCPACLRLVLAFENTNTKLASTSAARSPFVVDLRRMEAVDTSAVNA